MSGATIRILCVDDHSIVRAGLAALIAQESDMEVIAAAETGEQAVDCYREHRPDIVLMDLRLPAMSGFEAIRIIRKEDPNARIIVLTMYHGDEDIYRALEAGASGYLLKDTLPDTLIATIRQVHSGQAILPPTAAAQLARRISEPGLTPREYEVIRLLARGLRNKEIADTLAITQDTVIAHLRSIFGKLRVHDRTAAVSAAIERGIVHLD